MKPKYDVFLKTIREDDFDRDYIKDKILTGGDHTAFEVIPHSIDFVGGSQSIMPFVPDYLDSVSFTADATFDAEGVDSVTFATKAELQASAFYAAESLGVMKCAGAGNTRLSSMKTFYSSITDNTTNTYHRIGILHHDLPACTVEKFRFSCHYYGGEIAIDWGDGTIDIFDPADVESRPAGYTFVASTSSYRVTACHDYAGALTSAGVDYKKFIVRIYGKSVYYVRMTDPDYPDNNLMCRCFGDLPIAKSINALDSFAAGSKHLVLLDLLDNRPVPNVVNFFSCFSDCPNLLAAIGFQRFGTKPGCFTNFFSGDSILVSTDFRLPAFGVSDNSSGVIRNVFAGDKSLGGSNVKLTHKSGYVSTINYPTVATLLPGTGFMGENLDVYCLFYNCKYLQLGRNNTETLLAGDLLWRDRRIKWQNTGSAFSNSNATMRASVPTSWGGTLTYTVQDGFLVVPIYGGETIELTDVTSSVMLVAQRVIPPEKEISITVKRAASGGGELYMPVEISPGTTGMTFYYHESEQPLVAGGTLFGRIRGNHFVYDVFE